MSTINPRVPFYVSFQPGDGWSEFEKRLSALSTVARRDGFLGIKVLRHHYRKGGGMEVLVRFVEKTEVKSEGSFPANPAGGDRPGVFGQEHVGGDPGEHPGSQGPRGHRATRAVDP